MYNKYASPEQPDASIQAQDPIEDYYGALGRHRALGTPAPYSPDAFPTFDDGRYSRGDADLLAWGDYSGYGGYGAGGIGGYGACSTCGYGASESGYAPIGAHEEMSNSIQRDGMQSGERVFSALESFDENFFPVPRKETLSYVAASCSSTPYVSLSRRSSSSVPFPHQMLATGTTQNRFLKFLNPGNFLAGRHEPAGNTLPPHMLHKTSIGSESARRPAEVEKRRLISTSSASSGSSPVHYEWQPDGMRTPILDLNVSAEQHIGTHLVSSTFPPPGNLAPPVAQNLLDS